MRQTVAMNATTVKSTSRFVLASDEPGIRTSTP
jgi:membrane associated rhomboid family serine protease